MPTQSPNGFIDGSQFSDAASLVAYCNANAPITVHLPRGVWDFTGVNIPPGVTFIGCGVKFDSPWPNGGFGDGTKSTVITGAPQQPGGPGMNRFQGIVFDSGITMRMQFSVFENCAFSGAGIVFEGISAPYYSVVDKCWFRDVTGPNIHLKDGANAIHITNCAINVKSGQRGIVGEKIVGDAPGQLTVTNTSIESLPNETIGSLIYGDFRNSKFSGLYMEAGACSDGEAIVLSNESKHNEFWLPSPFNLGYVDNGFWNTFHSGIGDLANVNFDGQDLGSMSSPPRWLNSTHPTATLPPTSKLYHQFMYVSSTVGTTYTAAPGNTINGQPSLIVGIDEVYLVGGLFQAPSTDLKALQIK